MQPNTLEANRLVSGQAFWDGKPVMEAGIFCVDGKYACRHFLCWYDLSKEVVSYLMYSCNATERLYVSLLVSEWNSFYSFMHLSIPYNA